MVDAERAQGLRFGEVVVGPVSAAGKPTDDGMSDGPSDDAGREGTNESRQAGAGVRVARR
jgi:hypothetical protein